MSNISSLVQIFDRGGNYLAELEVGVTRSWLLNRYGAGQMIVSNKDTKTTETNLQYGNFVFVQHPDLPAWCGIIVPNRNWRNDGTIEINLKGAEYLMKRRRGPNIPVELSGTSGSIFTQVIDYMNSAGDSRVRKGEIYLGGATRTESIGPTPLYDDARRVASRAQNDWELLPIIDDDNRLILEANWYEYQGIVLDGVRLIEGDNIELNEIALREQGEIINDLLGYGDGATWKDKPIFVSVDQNSINKYGLWQGVKEFQGNTKIPTLQSNTEDYLRTKAFPDITASLTVIDKNNIFKHMRLGNSIQVNMVSVGFMGRGRGYTAMTRITGLAYDDHKSGEIKLTCDEEVFDDEQGLQV